MTVRQRGLWDSVRAVSLDNNSHIRFYRNESSEDSELVHALLRQLVSGLRRAKPDTEPYMYAWRLYAFMHSSFNLTLQLDSDLSVLDPMLPAALFNTASRVSDVAFPMDPNRGTSKQGSGDLWASGSGIAVPPLCGCMILYRQSASVAKFFFGAALRLIHHRHKNVRQGDQEMMWFEWIEGYGRGLRILVLPEEFYCPGIGPEPGLKGYAIAWRTSWLSDTKRQEGVYSCRAVHSHSMKIYEHWAKAVQFNGSEATPAVGRAHGGKPAKRDKRTYENRTLARKRRRVVQDEQRHVKITSGGGVSDSSGGGGDGGGGSSGGGKGSGGKGYSGKGYGGKGNGSYGRGNGGGKGNYGNGEGGKGNYGNGKGGGNKGKGGRGRGKGGRRF